MSKDLLYILSDKENYSRFAPYIKEHVLSKEVYQIVRDLEDYYTSHSLVEWEEFKEWFTIVKHPTYKLEKLELFSDIFDNMAAYTESPIAEDIIKKYILQHVCTGIADLALRGAEGEAVDVAEIDRLLTSYHEEVGTALKLADFINTESLEDIVNRHSTDGLTWPIEFLNTSIGLLTTSKLVVLGARPSVGKTTFLGNCACHFLKQVDGPILWINNEEEEGSVKKRIVQCGTHWPSADINSHPLEATKEFEAQVGDLSRIMVINGVTFDKQMCEDMFKKYKPAVIIIDQLRKVKSKESARTSEVDRLEHLYSWAREMAKTYAPVVTVHQLKGEAEGKPYPDMSMLYGSTTAVQGEADAILMLGRDYGDTNQNMRYISVVKQKEAMGPFVDPSLAEGKDIIELIPDKAEFKEFK